MFALSGNAAAPPACPESGLRVAFHDLRAILAVGVWALECRFRTWRRARRDARGSACSTYSGSRDEDAALKPTTRRTRLGAAVLAALLLVGTAAQAHVRPRSGAQAADQRCLSVQLKVRLGRAGAALGHIGQVVSFKNTSATTCTLHGYPGLQMLNAAGHPIATQALRGIAYTVPSVPERVVTLTPGAEASFDLGYDDSTGYENDKCPVSARVEITPPNAYKPITVSWRIQPYGGGSVTHVRCGQITVSPVFAGH